MAAVARINDGVNQPGPLKRYPTYLVYGNVRSIASLIPYDSLPATVNTCIIISIVFRRLHLLVHISAYLIKTRRVVLRTICCSFPFVCKFNSTWLAGFSLHDILVEFDVSYSNHLTHSGICRSTRETGN